MNDFFLADDLSGALDAAAAFYRAGRHVRISLKPGSWERLGPDEVVGVTTETRNMTSTAAGGIVRGVLAVAIARGEQLRYKKIDSTLRGPVAAELDAVMTALPGHRVLFAPANPAVGRTVENGRLLVNGVPVAETAFGRDPSSPLRVSAIREILGSAAKPEVAIPDTRTADDLAEAVKRMEEAGDPWIPVGSGALAVPVAARRGSAPPYGQRRAPSVRASSVLMISGSAHALNAEQAERLAKVHGVPVHLLSLDHPGVRVESAVDALRRTGSASLTLPLVRTSPAVALRAITEAATLAIAQAQVRRLFITGGETAFALCGRLGISALDFVSEIEPGLSLSVGEAPDGAYLLAVKPGGFGDQDTWIRAWQALREFAPSGL